MDYEQKYKEALERCKKEFNFNNLAYSHEQIKQKLEHIFPELKEKPDDKRMWTLIKKYAHCNISDTVLKADHITREYLESWLEKQDKQKQVSITDEWIENYWQHEKVNNPNSYDKGDEIQFNHDGFVRFCKKYCQKPTWSKEDEDSVDIAIRIIQNGGDDCTGILDSDKALKWLQSLKQRLNGYE